MDRAATMASLFNPSETSQTTGTSGAALASCVSGVVIACAKFAVTASKKFNMRPRTHTHTTYRELPCTYPEIHLLLAYKPVVFEAFGTHTCQGTSVSCLPTRYLTLEVGISTFVFVSQALFSQIKGAHFLGERNTLLL